jgi:hypothetical protein
MNRPTPQQVRQLLADVLKNLASYGDGELLQMKNSVDVLSFYIRAEREAQASRMVDDACGLEVA